MNGLARIAKYLDLSTRRTIYDSLLASNFFTAFLCGISVE